MKPENIKTKIINLKEKYDYLTEMPNFYVGRKNFKDEFERVIVDPYSSIYISYITTYTFKEHFLLHYRYHEEDNLHELYNDDLAINAFGTNAYDVYNELIHEIYSHALVYTKFPEDELSPDSIDLKHKWKYYVDFDKVMKALEQYLR